MANLGGCNAKVQACGDGCQYVIEVIGADKVALNLHHRAVGTSIGMGVGSVVGQCFKGKCVGIPLYSQEWVGTNYVPPHVSLFVLPVAYNSGKLALACHFNQIAVACVEESERVVSLQEVV